ncbi:MAG: isoprenylcysteine carboxylmethyltransferase family protein [Pyrinomonadaceae bacterium]
MKLNEKAWLSLFILAVAMGLLLFLPAGTVRYWQAWVYLTVFTCASSLLTLYLMRRDPALLERRMSGGPTAEKRKPQKVVSTGPYAVVRHPMYAGGLLYLAATPLALGSYWGLLAFAALLPFLIWRLLDEEQLLAVDLTGYREYQQRVRHRLVPFVW